MSSSVRNRIALATLIPILALASGGGCATSPVDETISARTEIIDRSAQALTASTLLWANGTYTGCTSAAHTGNWSARISGVAPMDYTALTVVKNDTGCVLTLTQLVGASPYKGTAIALGSSYAVSGSAFSTFLADGAVNPILFYTNAKLSSVLYAADFTLTILVSDNLADSSSPTSATYATVTSSGNGASAVPAPNYTAAFGSLSITTDVNQAVQTATGTVALNAGSQAGETYVVDANQSLGSTFAAIDTAYGAGTPVAVAATIPVASFTLGSATLPTVRNLIVLHTANNVKAYQIVRITFTAATT
ncbi:MAG: hypothetical protein M3O50_07095 [Myxococcota bacterium]|nr:hypothetical protein [Myxococcota bacterium]